MEGSGKSSSRSPSAARKRFLDAARKEFAAKGYAGASIRAITGSLHMRESAFYAHFKSKEEVYEELFHEAGPDVMVALAATIDPARPIQTELTNLARQAMQAWTSADARASTSIILREALSADGQQRRHMVEGVSRALDLLAGKLSCWQKRGLISEKLDAHTLAFEFVAPLTTTRLLFYGAASSVSDRKRGRQMVEKHIVSFLQLISNK